MSSGAKRCAEDEEDHADNMKKVGLTGDPVFGSIAVYSADAITIGDAARKNLSRDETIKLLIRAKHNRAAEAEIKEYFASREVFEQLKKIYK